jgi:hypothetical protein
MRFVSPVSGMNCPNSNQIIQTINVTGPNSDGDVLSLLVLSVNVDSCALSLPAYHTANSCVLSIFFERIIKRQILSKPSQNCQIVDSAFIAVRNELKYYDTIEKYCLWFYAFNVNLDNLKSEQRYKPSIVPGVPF